MLRLFVAITPVAGAITLPIIVPVTISYLGIGPGVAVTLVLSTLWFVAMLRTAEMPH